MTKKRRRRKPEQIVRAIQEGEAMLSAGKSEAEVFQALEISSATWDRWKKPFGGMKHALSLNTGGRVTTIDDQTVRSMALPPRHSQLAVPSYLQSLRSLR